MAKQRAVADDQQEEVQAIDLSDVYEADEMNSALEQLYTELGGEGANRVVVYIYKLNPDTGKEARIWNGPPSDYDLMAFAKRHGSGDYRVKIMAPSGRGNPAIKVNQIVTIALDPADDARIAAVRRGELPMSTTQQPLTEQRIVEIVAAAMKQYVPAPTSIDPLAMLKQVGDVMKSIMPSPAQQPQSVDPFGMLRGVIGIVKEMRGDELPRDNNGRVDREGLVWERGIGLLENILKQKNAVQPQASQPPVDQSSPEQQQMLAQITMALQYAVSQAKQGADVTKFAEMAYDMVDEATVHQLYNDPQWYETLVNAVPDVANHKEWFTKLRAQLIAFAQEDGWLTADGKLVETPVHGDPHAGATTGAGTGKTD